MRAWPGVFAALALGLMPFGSSASEGADTTVTTTRHVVKLRNGHKLGYTARAGYLTLTTDDTREEVAHLYFVAYTADLAAGAAARPITFVFPGGPGNAASLSPDGPKRVVVKDGEAQVTDNPDTFLAFTDLVLVDPVGTGYSRVTKPEYTRLFYGIKQDTDSMVEFMRMYLQRYVTSESPLFLSGGSWGSVRSILVAEAAMDRGIPVRGIMITAEGAILSVIGSDSYYATLIPGFTAVALHYRKLPADLMVDRDRTIEEAKTWAFDAYLPAIARGNTLSAGERGKIVSQMARLTGLKAGVIEAHNLRINQEVFANELLRDEGKSIGFYDTRMTGPAQKGDYDATKDPSLMARGNAYPSLKERILLNKELGMVSGNYYAGPFGGGWPVKEGFQDWMSIKWGFSLKQEPVGEGVEIVLPAFVHIVNRNVRVLMGQGNYDWACPPFGVDYVASRVAPAHKQHITVTRYESGHDVPEAEFAKDAATFVASVLKESPSMSPEPGAN